MARLSPLLFLAILALAPALPGPAAAQGNACGSVGVDRVQVLFATGSSRLDARARDLVRRAAERSRAQYLPLCIVGKASKRGDAAANARLARARAQAIADALIARGVPRNYIRTESQGEGFGDWLFGGSTNDAQTDRSADIVFLSQVGQDSR